LQVGHQNFTITATTATVGHVHIAAGLINERVINDAITIVIPPIAYFVFWIVGPTLPDISVFFAQDTIPQAGTITQDRTLATTWVGWISCQHAYIHTRIFSVGQTITIIVTAVTDFLPGIFGRTGSPIRDRVGRLTGFKPVASSVLIRNRATAGQPDCQIAALATTSLGNTLAGYTTRYFSFNTAISSRAGIQATIQGTHKLTGYLDAQVPDRVALGCNRTGMA